MKIPYLRFILNLFIKGGRLRKKRLGVTIKKSDCLFISWKKIFSEPYTKASDTAAGKQAARR